MILTALLLTNCGKPKTTTTTSKSRNTTTSAALPQSVGLRPIASLDQPLGLIEHKGKFWIIQKAGEVVQIDKDGNNKKVLLDISKDVSSDGERGLLGLAISPKYQNLLYLNYTNNNGDTRIVEYKIGDETIDSASARLVLGIAQPYANHNGGNLVFGPDGYLYIGMGDGGLRDDPANRAQNLNELLGKMLRIDPRKSGNNAYTVPSDNPFFGQAGKRGEIWAYGLRNPWRYSFDSKNKDLWIGDVGQDHFEEIDHQSLADSKGRNFGWSRFEASHLYQPSREAPNAIAPVAEYDHSNNRCAVTGGYIYRGSKIPALENRYIFGDYCSGEIWSIDPATPQDLRREPITLKNLVSFAQDSNGNLYALAQDGAVDEVIAQ
jgi:glucose/arabinose dehydrogenase